MNCTVERCSAQEEANGLCARHNREARKRAQAKPKAKPTAIRRLSAKGQQREAAIHKAYKQIEQERPHYCWNCGDNECTHSHILPRGQYQEFAANVRNIVYDCFACHDIWEHGSLEDVEQMSTFSQRLDIIQELYPGYFFRRFGLILSEYRSIKKV